MINNQTNKKDKCTNSDATCGHFLSNILKIRKKIKNTSETGINFKFWK